MKRSPLRPSLTPIGRTAALPRGATKIKTRGRSRFPKRRCPEYLAWLREQQCCITGSWTSEFWPVVAAHVKTRAAGGDDLYNAVPLDNDVHGEQHRIGMQSFQAKYGVDLLAIAREHTERFLVLHPELATWDHEEEAR